VIHTMLRVGNLERSISFYTERLGMQLLRKERYPSGSYTLAFVGYGSEHSGAVIELTHNWGTESYVHGQAFGHIALAVTNIYDICAQLAEVGIKVLREPGPMTANSPDRNASEVIAFIEDPDGYRIELIETH
jgi:lactoylglutathione lyase